MANELQATERNRLFLESYAKHWNAARAWRDMNGGAVTTMDRQKGYALLQTDYMRAEVERLRREAMARSVLSVQTVVDDIKAVLEADPRELTGHYIGACRHCYGKAFLHQYTPQEYREQYKAWIKAEARRKAKGEPPEPFPEEGGEGFNATRQPHPDCPECFGQGIGHVRAVDVRQLSPAAAKLYSGVKKTKDGWEMMTRSQDAARDQAAKFLGMHKSELNLNAKMRATDLTDDELAAMAASKQLPAP